jgi:hypothetical protein
MKAKQVFLFLLLAIFVFFPACEDCGDCAPPPEADYTSGIFVVNEGPFGGTGTITWHNPETGETVQDIFGKENGGATLGQFVQSLTFHNGKGYIVVNGANKIVVVDAKTFQFLDTIGGLALPRFFQRSRVDYTQAYVSQWGDDGLSGSLAKIDLLTNKVIKTIPTGSGPEKMFAYGNDILLVANSGGYGVDSTVLMVGMFDDEVDYKHFLKEKNPACLARMNSGDVFALCKGYYDDLNSTGWLGNFGPNTVGIPVDKYADDLVASPDGSALYFLGGGAIWMYNNNAVSKLFDQPAYGLACHPTTGDLYCADGKDFNSAGEVVIYKPDGTKTGSFPTGIAPGEIIFR